MNKNIKLASWNVNSLKVRLEQVKSLLVEEDLDILALQETKLIDAEFPNYIFQEMGYVVSFSGQKTYNGVAIISRKGLNDINTEIPLFADPQRRLIAATIGNLRLINLYVPNGSSLESDKYIYKLNWLENITQYIEEQLSIYPKLAVVGDFNIAPEDCDVHDIQEWQNDVLVSQPERLALQRILALNLFDSFRKFTIKEKHFSWWDYRAASFRRDRGLRIDLILLSKPLLAICTESKINREYRKKERSSDHAPVITTLDNTALE